MFAQSGHAPRGTVIERNEIRYQVRRLSSHACLFLWSGCNECTDLSIYVDLLGVIAEEDPYESDLAGVAFKWLGFRCRAALGHAGRDADCKRGTPGTIEAHGPYIRGGGFPAVNGVTNYEPVATDVRFDEPPVGLGSSVFIYVEFGAVAWASSESSPRTLSPRYRSLFGNQPPDVCAGDGLNVCKGSNVLARRNYPARISLGASSGRRRTTCGPAARHLRWWRTSTPHKISRLHHCTCAPLSRTSAFLVKNLVEAHRSAQRARPPRLAIE